MRSRSFLYGCGALILFLAFGWGVLRLFQLRFASGDVYPAYSSLRTDPLGTKAFYDSLKELPLSVERNYRTWDRIERDAPVVLLFGLQTWGFDMVSHDEVQDIETRLSGGDRLVFSFLPVPKWTEEMSQEEKRKREETEKREKSEAEEKKTPPPDGEASKKKQDKGSDETRKIPGAAMLSPRWGFQIAYTNLVENAGEAPVEARAVHVEGGDKGSVSWHTAAYFDRLDPAWRVVYTFDHRPVVIERSKGRGTIVLASDSFFVSNEAMRKERHTDLLLWLLGGHRHVVFDETHLGVEEEPGVAGLMRKYRLHGLMAGITLLALLFVWKNSTSFVPPFDEKAGLATGGASETAPDGTGFVNLLRRNVGNAQLMDVCYEEWNHGEGNRHVSPGVREQIRSLMAEDRQRAGRDRKPLRTYNAICRVLERKRGA